MLFYILYPLLCNLVACSSFVVMFSFYILSSLLPFLYFYVPFYNKYRPIKIILFQLITTIRHDKQVTSLIYRASELKYNEENWAVRLSWHKNAYSRSLFSVGHFDP